MAESSAAAAVTAIHAVSLKLPTFLAARPDVWFQQTEAQFNLRNITDSTTQYFYLLTSLDAAVAERMAGDVSLTPAVGKYEYLKSKLMGVYGLTDDQKADGFLTFPVLGTGHLHSCVHTSKVSQLTGIVFFDVFSCGSYQKMFECSSPHLGKTIYPNWHGRQTSSWLQNMPSQ